MDPKVLMFIVFNDSHRFTLVHCDLKVSSSKAKIDENFGNYFFKTKTNNKWIIVLKYT